MVSKYLQKVGVAIGSALLLTACTGVYEENGETGVKEPIVIGAIAPLTGDDSTIGVPISEALQWAAKQVNEAGGLKGSRVELKIQDGQCKGDAGREAAEKLVNVDKVQVILGGVCNPETLGAAPKAEEGKVVMIAYGASSPKISEAGDYIFRTYPSDTAKAALLADVVLKKNLKRVGIIVEQTDYAIPLKDAFVKSLQAGGGEAVVETYTSDAQDVRTQLTKLRDAKPKVDALFVDPQSPDKGLLIFQQMRELKFKPQILLQDVIATDTDTLTKEKDFLEGAIAADVPVKDKNPDVLKLREDYKKEYGKDLNFEVFVDAAYDAFMLAKEAIERVGNDGTKIKDYLSTVKNYQGLLGTYKEFDKNGDPVGIEFVPLLVKGGKTVVSPELAQ